MSAKQYRQIEGWQPPAGSPEPFFIAQTGECKTAEERQAWLQKVAVEARDQGSVWARATLGCHGHPDLLLFEAWSAVPAAQGEPRFQLTALSPEGDEAGVR